MYRKLWGPHECTHYQDFRNQESTQSSCAPRNTADRKLYFRHQTWKQYKIVLMYVDCYKISCASVGLFVEGCCACAFPYFRKIKPLLQFFHRLLFWAAFSWNSRQSWILSTLLRVDGWRRTRENFALFFQTWVFTKILAANSKTFLSTSLTSPVSR